MLNECRINYELLLDQKLNKINASLDKVKSAVPLLEMADLEYEVKQLNEIIRDLEVQLFHIRINSMYARVCLKSIRLLN